MKKISKHLISLAIISLLVVPLIAANAQTDPFGTNIVTNGVGNTLSQNDPRTIIARIINIALSFLGIIALGIILMGGFKWMTAAGNDQKTEEAKKLIGAGVIGLAIILASWGLASWLIGTLNNSINGNG